MHKIKLLALLILPVAVLACSGQETLIDVSSDPVVSPAIGKRYEIIGELDAYGIREHPKAPVKFIVLVPKPGFKAFEVGFKLPVTRGATITIVRVLKTNRVFVSPYSFVVQLNDVNITESRPIRVDLIQGNHGKGDIGLNPEIYKPI